MSDLWVPDLSGGSTPSSGMAMDDHLSRRLTMLKNAVPLFAQGSDGARMALQFAQGNYDDDTMIRTAQISASQTVMTNIRDQLNATADPVHQYRMYQGLDPGQKKLLSGMGYQAPIKPYDPGDTSVLGVLGGIGKGLLQDVANVAHLPGVRNVLAVPQKAVSGAQHLERAATLGIEEEGWFGSKVGSNSELAKRRANVVGDFMNLWSRTGNGEKTFTTRATDRVHNAIPEEDKYQFVEAAAAGQSTYDYLANSLKIDPSDPTFMTEYQKYNQYLVSPDIQDAVKDLKNNKISLGRQTAGAVFQRGSAPYNFLSGGVDAAYTIAFDPSTYALPALKTYRAAQLAIDASKVGEAGYLTQRINWLYENKPAIQRAFDLVATRFNEGNPQALLDELPQVSNGLQSMADHFAKQSGEITAEHVKSYFADNIAGQKALVEGTFNLPHFPSTVVTAEGPKGLANLPQLGRVQQGATAFKMGVKAGIENLQLSDLGLDQLSLGQLREGLGVKGATFAEVQKNFGNFLDSFVSKVPHQGFITPMVDAEGAQTNQSVKIFQAMLDYALPRQMQRDYLNDFMNATTFEGKRQVYQAGLDGLFHYSGALTTDAGKAVYNKFASLGTYADEGVDLLPSGSAGLGAKDMADSWAIPKFRELLEGTKDVTQFRKWMSESNSGMITRFMNYWRPSVLLRAGFVPRAYGEEMLTFLSREGLSSYAKSQAARLGAGEGTVLGLKTAQSVADSLTSHIPLVSDSMKEAVGNVSNTFFDGTSRYLRDFGEKLAPENYLATARMAANNPEVHNALARAGIGTAHGYASEELGQRVKAEALHKIDPSGEIVRVNVDYGDMALRGKGDLGHNFAVVNRMRYIADDPLYSPMIDAGRRMMSDEELTGLNTALTHGNLIPEKFVVGDDATRAQKARALLKSREYVPDAVMPNWEQFLKNDNFAYKDSVIGDLVKNGVDEETANQLYDVVKTLDPRLRSSVFTRDGELERMHRARTLDPEAAWNYESDLPFVRGQIEKYSASRLDDHLHDLWSAQDGLANDTLENITYDRLHQGDLQNIVQKAKRSRETLDGRMVASDVQHGYRRVYTVIMPSEQAPHFEEAGIKGAGINDVVDQKVGWVPLSHDGAYKIYEESTPGRIGQVEQRRLPAGTQTQAPAPGVVDFEGEKTPVGDMAWFSSNHSHSQQLVDVLNGKDPYLKASVGYVDVPEPIFRKGQDRAIQEVEGGLSPTGLVRQGDQVYIPKIYRQNYTAITEDGSHLITHADGTTSLAEGATQQEALRDWANRLVLAHQQLFGGNDYGWTKELAEIQHQVIAGRISIADLDKLVGEQIPDRAVGPLLMMPERGNWMHGLYSKGFDKIQAAGDALIRQPMYIHHLTLAMEDARALMDKAANPETLKTIDGFVNRMTGNRHQVEAAWRSLVPEVQGAVNPYEAALARDRVQEVLRKLDRPQLQKIGEASEQLYLNGDPKGLQALKNDADFVVDTRLPDWENHPDNFGKLTVDDIDKAKDSYLSFSPQERDRLLTHGVPDVFPKELMLRETGVPQQRYEGPLTKPSEESMDLKSDPNSPPAYKGDVLNHVLGGFALENGLPIRALNPLGEGSIPLKEFEETKDFITNMEIPEGTSDRMRHNFEQLRAAWSDTHPIAGPTAEEVQPFTTDEWTQFRGAMEDNKQLQDTVYDIAKNRAISNIIPFVHDHHLRSQFQEHARNFVPFWFAQENFIGRVAKMAIRDPAIIRHAQLLQHGLEASGVITKNQYGEEVFNIPATGALSGVLAKGANYFGRYTLPVVNAFSGQVNHTLPGLDELTNIGPSFSPVLTVPSNAITRRFPELQAMNHFVQGGMGENRSAVEQVVPSYLYSFYQGLTHSPDADQHMVSSAIQAAQMLEASGHGLSETDAHSMSEANNKGSKLQEYFDRIDNHTRLNFMLKGIFGFFSPVSPNPDPVEQFTPEFQDLLRKLPLSEAQAAFTQAHPDALPYEIFKTQVDSGAPLPATEAADAALTMHPDFFGKYPDAAPWLLPQSNSTDSFSQKAYNQQLAMGLRTRKSLKEWYEDYYFASAAPNYFASEEDYKTRYAALAGNTPARAQLNQQWQQVKDDYFKAHPVFAEVLNDPTSKERRARTLDTIESAINDPNAPDVLHKKPLADMVATYKDVQSRLDQLKGSAQWQISGRQALKDQFVNWASMYTNENPQTAAFYNRVIRPDMRV